jgi:hypothetical protein
MNGDTFPVRLNKPGDPTMRHLTLATLALSLVTTLSTPAMAAALPSGQYLAADGSSALVTANSEGWSINDPEAPDIVIRGDYQGRCTVLTSVEAIPCMASIGQSKISVAVPSIGFALELTYAATSASSAAASRETQVAYRSQRAQEAPAAGSVIARGAGGQLDQVNARAFYNGAAICHQMAAEAFPYSWQDAVSWLSADFPTWGVQDQTAVANFKALWDHGSQNSHTVQQLCSGIAALIYGVDQEDSAQGSTASESSPELPAITYDGMGNMDGTVTISDGGMSYDY